MRRVKCDGNQRRCTKFIAMDPTYSRPHIHWPRPTKQLLPEHTRKETGEEKGKKTAVIEAYADDYGDYADDNEDYAFEYDPPEDAGEEQESQILNENSEFLDEDRYVVGRAEYVPEEGVDKINAPNTAEAALSCVDTLEDNEFVGKEVEEEAVEDEEDQALHKSVESGGTADLAAAKATQIDRHNSVHRHSKGYRFYREQEWHATNREPSPKKRKRNRPACYSETSGGLDDKIPQAGAYPTAPTKNRGGVPKTYPIIEDTKKKKGRKAQTIIDISVSDKGERVDVGDGEVWGPPNPAVPAEAEAVDLDLDLDLGLDPGMTDPTTLKINELLRKWTFLERVG